MSTAVALDTRHQIGANNPPPAATFNPVEILRANLEARHAAIVTRQKDLVAAVDRVPEKIENDEVCGRAGDFVKQLGACMTLAEATRKAEKQPHLDAGKAVDAFFNEIITGLEAEKKKIQKRMTDFQVVKEREERLAREREEAEARRQAEQAQKEAAELAGNLETEEDLERAIAAEEDAKQATAVANVAEKIAAAPAADLSRTRGSYGAVASLRTTWDFKNLDRAKIDLEKLREHLSADALEKAVRAFVRAGGRTLAGVDIYEKKSTVVS